MEVIPVTHRYLELSPWTAAAEAAVGSAHLVPQLVAKGWPLLAEVAPAAAAVVTPLAYDPGPLVDALAGTPQTFVHSNWKLDNLGTDDQGRTVLLDWEQPGRGAALSDLAWYLAINCRRLPQAKEAAIAVYREALEAAGVRHRALVGPAAGAVPARRAGAVRLGEGARRLRRGAGMVGGPGGRGGAAAELTAAVRASYDAAAGGWAGGPGPMYDRLAAALVAAAPVPLAGCRVLDLGAGTGAAGRAALAAGAAQVVAADLAVGMLRARGPGAAPGGWPTRRALPFRAASFDLVAAAFCLNHLPDPAAGLAEARRVGAALAASTFAPGWTHPAKDAVDAALRPFGYREPAWHACLSRGPGIRRGGRSGAAGRAGGRGRLPPGAGAHGHRADRAGHPGRAGRLAAGPGPVRPVPAPPGRPGPAAARRAAERAVAQAVGQAAAGPRR